MCIVTKIIFCLLTKNPCRLPAEIINTKATLFEPGYIFQTKKAQKILNFLNREQLSFLKQIHALFFLCYKITVHITPSLAQLPNLKFYERLLLAQHKCSLDLLQTDTKLSKLMTALQPWKTRKKCKGE